MSLTVEQIRVRSMFSHGQLYVNERWKKELNLFPKDGRTRNIVYKGISESSSVLFFFIVQSLFAACFCHFSLCGLL